MNKPAFETKKMVIGIDLASAEGDFSAEVLAEIRDGMVRVIDRTVCNAWGATPPVNHMSLRDFYSLMFEKMIDLSSDEYKVLPLDSREG